MFMHIIGLVLGLYFQLCNYFVIQYFNFHHCYFFQVYPDEAHGLTNVKPHLYRTMENFLDSCFGIAEQDEKVPAHTPEEKKR